MLISLLRPQSLGNLGAQNGYFCNNFIDDTFLNLPWDQMKIATMNKRGEFLRNCEAASAGKYNKSIWFYQLSRCRKLAAT